MKRALLLAGLIAHAGAMSAGPLELRVIGGSVQLGGTLTFAVTDAGAPLPDGARCQVALPAPFDGHVRQETEECGGIVLSQGLAPLRDPGGAVLPSQQVPAKVRVLGADGAEIGSVSTFYPYQNAFSDLKIVIEGVKNPVSAGQSFTAMVTGAGQPIDPSLTCRWNTYGPVRFEPASDNLCTGTVTALDPTGIDADMDVEIVNLTDMHAVGYALAKMIVQ